MTPEEELRQKLIAESLRQKVPLAVLDPTCKWTSSKDQAAVEALNRTLAGIHEVGGAIFQNEKGEYCYSIPVGNERNRRFKLRAQSTPAQKLAGIYHTHPPEGAEEQSQYFSHDDINMAEQLKMASYIKVLRDGAVKKFEPGTTRTKKLVGGKTGALYSEGEPVRSEPGSMALSTGHAPAL